METAGSVSHCGAVNHIHATFSSNWFVISPKDAISPPIPFALTHSEVLLGLEVISSLFYSSY